MPLPDAVIAGFHTMEEKGPGVAWQPIWCTDVWQGLFESAVVTSNDSDLGLPIRMVTEELRRPVLVVCPGRWQVAPHGLAPRANVTAQLQERGGMRDGVGSERN